MPLFSINEALWKTVAIALFAALLGTAGYLGYQWSSAESDLSIAKEERSKAEAARDEALTEVGTLRTLLSRQNEAISRASDATQKAALVFAEAMRRSADYDQQVHTLLQQVGTTKSLNCESAIARQRKVIENLKLMKEQK